MHRPWKYYRVLRSQAYTDKEREHRPKCRTTMWGSDEAQEMLCTLKRNYLYGKIRPNKIPCSSGTEHKLYVLSSSHSVFVGRPLFIPRRETDVIHEKANIFILQTYRLAIVQRWIMGYFKLLFFFSFSHHACLAVLLGFFVVTLRVCIDF